MLSRFLSILLAAGVFLAASQFVSRAYGAVDDHRAESTEQKLAEDLRVESDKTVNPMDVKGFNFPFDLTVWTAVVFVLVFAILYKNAWGPIAAGLDKRETDIAGQIAEAHRRNEEARQLLADYEKKIAAAHDEVRQIIDEGRRNSERVGQELLDKAKQQSATEVQRGKQQIEAATSTALLELAQRSSELAVELAGKIVRQKLSSTDHAQLIGDAVSKFSMQASGDSSSTPV